MSLFLTIAYKYPRILRDPQTSIRPLLHIGKELSVPLRNILSLVAMAGQDIRDQRLRIRHDQAVFVGSPLHICKTGLQHIPAILPAKPLVKLICGQHDMFVKTLYQFTDFFHMVVPVGAADQLPALL